MRAEARRFESGWLQVAIRVRPSDVQQLISRLQELSADSHFHLRATFEDDNASPGVADVEISLQGPDEPNNMRLE